MAKEKYIFYNNKPYLLIELAEYAGSWDFLATMKCPFENMLMQRKLKDNAKNWTIGYMDRSTLELLYG